MLAPMLQDHVICQTDPDLWFSDSQSGKLLAQDFCSTCFFKEDCLKLAVSNNEVHGIWGGIDFSDPNSRKTSDIVLCRAKKHLRKRGENCSECKKEAQKRYNAKRDYSKSPKKTKPRKHVLGGYCVNGHKLEESTTTVRSSDQALLCKKCITGRTYGIYRKNSSSRS
jgi:hypothetical protein